MNITNILASRSSKLKTSAIREILKLAATPGMISLGGGLPSPESFPLELIEELTETALKKYGCKALQYDLTEGFVPLREALIDHLAKQNIKAGLDNIYITSGSQGFIDSIGKLLISPGDYVAVEGPTYLAALQSFNAYEARYLQMETDHEGLIPQSMEEIIDRYPVKFVYTVPTFQNPTGKTIGLHRRKKIAEIIKEKDVLLVEDDPYSALRYEGRAQPSIKSLAPDNVVYVSTFSKIFAPGLRTGFIVAPPELGRWLVAVKQAVDLNTCVLAQALAAEYLKGGHLEKQLKKIISLYKPKFQKMLKALPDYFPSSFSWYRPEGGMFVWACGPKSSDMEDLYHLSIQRKVGFVPGKFFYPNPEDGHETMRLNFTSPSMDEIDQAMKILGQTAKEYVNNL